MKSRITPQKMSGMNEPVAMVAMLLLLERLLDLLLLRLGRRLELRDDRIDAGVDPAGIIALS